jgi:hypothetical protein
LTLLSAVLQKPLTYFFPEGWISDIPPEQELLIQSRRLGDEDLRRFIVQIRALADLEDGDTRYTAIKP